MADAWVEFSQSSYLFDLQELVKFNFSALNLVKLREVGEEAPPSDSAPQLGEIHDLVG